jgi:hypothetical protein
MRYYAEVPLTCPRGYVIGSYCVVDNKLRDDFDEESFRILNEVSLTIMDHLELMKTKHNHSRAKKLIKGLGSFMEGDSCLNTTFPVSAGSEQATENQVHVELGYSPARNYTSYDAIDASEGPGSSSTRTSSIHSSSESSAPPEMPFTSPFKPQSDTSDTTPEIWSRSDPMSQQRSPDQIDAARRGLRESAVSAEVRKTFYYAASVIRESMRIDGVTFLDACLAQFNALALLKISAAPGLLDAGVVNSETEQVDMEPQSISANLGFSISSEGDTTKDEPSKYCPNLPEPLLQRMIARYPRGQYSLPMNLGHCHSGAKRMALTFRLGLLIYRKSRPRNYYSKKWILQECLSSSKAP